MARRTISGSRAIVTGASSGIGRALALELARQGACLLLVARRGAPAGRGRRDRRGRPGTLWVAELLAGDVVDPAVRQEALRLVQERFGGLDILVNNAGVGAMGLFEKADPQRLRRVMEVNFFAPGGNDPPGTAAAEAGHAADPGQRQLDPRPSRRAPQQRVLRQQVRPARVQRGAARSLPAAGSTCWWSAPARRKPNSSTASWKAPASRAGRSTGRSARPRSRGRSCARFAAGPTRSSPTPGEESSAGSIASRPG